MMHGRPPVNHPWPLNHVFSQVDISDPHTFLSIKRGILQYAWIKPLLGIATVIMRATNTYQEGYIGLSSGYFWSSVVYNISITLSLYSLAMFWVCMSQDLKPFRPMPKFLCIKLIIFASYWQGFFLSILQWLGAIPNDVPAIRQTISQPLYKMRSSASKCRYLPSATGTLSRGTIMLMLPYLRLGCRSNMPSGIPLELGIS